jgi:hypothetical protein
MEHDTQDASIGHSSHPRHPCPFFNVLPLFQQLPPYQGPAYGTLQGPNLIGMDDKESIVNVFCFGAFADKNNGVVYKYLTGSFPFISLDGSICFLVMYHYEANAILTMPISALDDISIFNTYKMQFDDITSKGFKPKINIMDNQVTKHIKAFLTEQQCKLHLIEPHNHRMNAPVCPGTIGWRVASRTLGQEIHALSHSSQKRTTKGTNQKVPYGYPSTDGDCR